MHTMRTIAFSIANVAAGRQPLVSTLATDTRHIRPADKFVDPFTFHFAENVPVARSPALDQDENHRMVTIPCAGQAQTPIRRRVEVVHKTDYENVTEQMKEEYGACLNLQRVAPPPTRRFLECSDDDLKTGGVDVEGLVEDLRMPGGFLEEEDVHRDG